MEEVKDIIKHGHGKWLVAYTVPYCCGWHRYTKIIESEQKPSKEQALYEIRNQNKEH